MTTNDTFLAALLGELTFTAEEIAASEAAAAARSAEYTAKLAAERAALPKPCGKCNGRGRLEMFNHISGGVCFQCEGTGKAGHFSSRRVTHGGDMEEAF
jgi:DnaJ-class molecular chaperone